MVARGAGAAGPVLLACHQWDLRGLARRLPSLGASAWRGAPLLPWRVQCRGRVCAALAAGSGGSGRYLVSCPPRFPLPAPRVLRCVWRAVPSGCPLPSLAGTPFHAVCAFRGLGPVALLVFPACPLCVCALALPRRPLPPPLLVGVARAPRAVPVLGAGRAVPCGSCPSACPASVPCSVWLAWGGGGGGPVPFPLYLAWDCALPVGWVCAPGALQHRGAGWGGGGLCAVPTNCAAGGASGAGGRLASVRLSAFPGQAAKRVSLASLWPWRAWPPYRSGLCSLAVPRRGSCGVLVRSRGFACSSWFLREQAAGSVEAGPAPASLSGAAVLPGGGGIIPAVTGVVGAGAPVACGPVGGVGGPGGGGRAVAPLLPFWGGWLAAPYPAPLSSPAYSPLAYAFGRGRGAAPCAGCGLPPAGQPGGGGERRPPNRAPGGSNRPGPSLCPPWAGNIAGVIGDALVMGGAAPILPILLPMHVGWACSLGYTSSVTILLSAVLAASSCVSFTPPQSWRDLLLACAL